MTTRAVSPHPTKHPDKKHPDRKHPDKEHPRTNQRRIETRRGDKAVLTIGAVLAVMLAVTLVALLRPGHRAAVAGSTGTSASLLPGVTQTPPPWPAEYANLPSRLTALNMPNPGHERYHIHAHLTVFVNGVAVAIPADIGMDEAHGVGSAMHTHEADGVIHIEADAASNVFTLGSFFDVWGVALSPTQLGSFTATGAQGVRLYVNGRKVEDPDTYLLKRHDNVVLAYGTDDSFPHTVPFTWPEGE